MRSPLAIGLLCSFVLGLTPAAAEASCPWWRRASCEYTKTRHPIVLAHGLLGFDSIGDRLEYFYGIPDALRRGGAEVYVTLVSQANSSTQRGEQLLERLEELRAITGHEKFNLIGHSQGGLDARYVASVRPDLVASVTAVASPHAGIPGMDRLLDVDFLTGLAGSFLEVLGGAVNLLTGSDLPLDGDAAIAQFLPAGIESFNEAHPQGLPESPCGEGPPVVDGVRYYSWSGTAGATNILDPIDAFFALSDALVVEGDSDGFIERCSSHLGDVIRDDYGHNHLDEVNQLLGLVPVFQQSPASIFRAHANRLKNAGL